MRKTLLFAAWFAISCGLHLHCGRAQAAQQLIPTPYPEMLGPNSMDTPIQQPHYHQELLPDAAPASKGVNALGNPHLHHGYHQHPVHTPYPRQWWRRHYWEQY
jgi:hypothetical protein